LLDGKVCIVCKTFKLLTDFPRHCHSHDGLDSRCRSCETARKRYGKQLRCTAPPRPKVCPCCRKVPVKWVLDHDHATEEIRNWLCDPCNTGIGQLGDNIAGVFRALVYLIKAKVKLFSGEQLMLGLGVAHSTVSKYMVQGGPRSQSWKTFLCNHAQAIARSICV